MNAAVPAAPATCWTVPIVALPWEYRCRGSAPVAAVNIGVNRKPRPRLSTMCVTSTNQIGVSAPKKRHRPDRRAHDDRPRQHQRRGTEAVVQPTDERTEQTHQQARRAAG